MSAILTVTGIPGQGDEEEREEDWGWISLAAEPRVGDYIHLLHELEIQIVRIEQVTHYAVKIPLPEISLKEPRLEIEAKWITIDLSSYRH